jgi:hypothetical protein
MNNEQLAMNNEQWVMNSEKYYNIHPIMKHPDAGIWNFCYIFEWYGINPFNFKT